MDTVRSCDVNANKNKSCDWAWSFFIFIKKKLEDKQNALVY